MRRFRRPTVSFEEASRVRTNLLKAFKELRKEGIVARANYMCCQSCGCAGIDEALVKNPKKIGFTFWHHQDNEDLQNSGKVYLAYGIHAGDETDEECDKKVLLVANKIVDKLKEAGLIIEWNGNTNTRILVKGNQERFETEEKIENVKIETLPLEQKQLEQINKPKCKLIGQNGNIFNLMGLASRALKEAGQPEKVREMTEKITTGAGSYEEALTIIGKYVEIF